nr:PREDICTED: uncharacterized protein LOC102693857 [Lepisosteus oculatus]
MSQSAHAAPPFSPLIGPHAGHVCRTQGVSPHLLASGRVLTSPPPPQPAQRAGRDARRRAPAPPAHRGASPPVPRLQGPGRGQTALLLYTARYGTGAAISHTRAGSRQRPVSKMASEPDYESILLVKPDINVYRIPPRASNRGYRAADWKLEQPDWVGRLRITARGKVAYIKLEDKVSGELFAQAPVEQYPGITCNVTAVTHTMRQPGAV